MLRILAPKRLVAGGLGFVRAWLGKSPSDDASPSDVAPSSDRKRTGTNEASLVGKAHDRGRGPRTPDGRLETPAVRAGEQAAEVRAESAPIRERPGTSQAVHSRES